MKHIARLSLSFIIAASATGAIFAAEQPHYYYTGKDLHEVCKAFRNWALTPGTVSGADIYKSAICVGYVLGVVDTGGFKPPADPARTVFCIGKGVKSDTLAKVVADYIDTQPIAKSPFFDGPLVVTQALSEAWPCPPSERYPVSK